jgi:hypothetical protein
MPKVINPNRIAWQRNTVCQKFDQNRLMRQWRDRGYSELGLQAQGHQQARGGYGRVGLLSALSGAILSGFFD